MPNWQWIWICMILDSETLYHNYFYTLRLPFPAASMFSITLRGYIMFSFSSHTWLFFFFPILKLCRCLLFFGHSWIYEQSISGTMRKVTCLPFSNSTHSGNFLKGDQWKQFYHWGESRHTYTHSSFVFDDSSDWVASYVFRCLIISPCQSGL